MALSLNNSRARLLVRAVISRIDFRITGKDSIKTNLKRTDRFVCKLQHRRRASLIRTVPVVLKNEVRMLDEQWHIVWNFNHF